MTEGVVDELEVVEVDEQHGDASRVALQIVQGMTEPVDEGQAIGGAGQGVVQGLMGEHSLGRFQLGQVPRGSDHAGHGPVQGHVGHHAHMPPAGNPVGIGGVVHLAHRLGLQDTAQGLLQWADYLRWPAELDVGPPDDHLGRRAQHGHRLGIDHLVAERLVISGDGIRRTVQDGPELRSLADDFSLGLDPGGNVPRDAEGPDNGPVVIAQGGLAGLEPGVWGLGRRVPLQHIDDWLPRRYDPLLLGYPLLGQGPIKEVQVALAHEVVRAQEVVVLGARAAPALGMVLHNTLADQQEAAVTVLEVDGLVGTGEEVVQAGVLQVLARYSLVGPVALALHVHCGSPWLVPNAGLMDSSARGPSRLELSDGP